MEFDTGIFNGLKEILLVVLTNAKNLIGTVARTIFPQAPEMAAIALIIVAVWIFKEKMDWWMWLIVIVIGAYIFMGGF